MRLQGFLSVIFILLMIPKAGLLRPAFAFCAELPSIEDVRAQHHPSDWSIVDRNGHVLQETRINKNVRRLDWVALKDISPNLKEAIIRAEDKRFYSHFGVDPLAMANAVLQRITSSQRRGASTISMQVAGFLEEQITGRKSRAGYRGFKQKLLQIQLAIQLESKWTKDQIFESYLNAIYFRGELQGLMAASLSLFGKWPHGLTPEESALLAALIRSPNVAPHIVADRACRLGQTLWNWEKTQCQTTKDIASRNLVSGVIPERAQLAPHASRIVLQQIGKSQPGRSIIKTTLDADLQKFARESLQRHVVTMQSQNMHDGAVVVLDNATGDVLAYVGNIGEQSSAKYVDGARALRQAGSTLKPFLFARAFERKLLTPATLLRDTPLGIAVETGTYRPQNYDRNFKDLVSARTALASSLNIPAVKTLEIITVDDLVSTLINFGVQSLDRPDFYGPSLALGSADVRLWDMVNSYRTLANDGKFSDARFLPDQKLSNPVAVMSPEAVYLVKNILSDRDSRSLTFGLENMLSTKFWTAVKTGTSKDMRDNWCIGFSRRFTVGVWTGNFSGDSMWNVTGVHGAAPVWADVMNYLHRQIPSESPAPPPGVIEKSITFVHSKVTRNEWFIAGTEPMYPEIRSEDTPLLKIVYPVNLAVIALDPDLSYERELVYFRVSHDDPNASIYLDGKRVGPARQFTAWRPTPGKHRLKVVDANNQTLDRIVFFVKGHLKAPPPSSMRSTAFNKSEK